jgi:predicted MFS family arabinose efflux permease
MRQPPKKESLQEAGLKKRLNEPAMIKRHKGIDYDKFIEYYDNPKISTVALAALMGYENTTTVYTFINQLIAERGYDNGK